MSTDTTLGPRITIRAAIERTRAWWEIDHRRRAPSREHRPCPYCGGPMVPDQRTDESGEPVDLIAWRKCAGCGQHQEGDL